MIVADSSAWIDFIRRPDQRLGPALRHLLSTEGVAMTGIVLVEILRGLRSDTAEEVGELLTALPFIETTKEAWIRAGEMARALEEQGIPIPIGDVVIAATVLAGEHELLTRDKHFERIPGLRLYDWSKPDA